jgi:RND family efflux transporter MFP subunit
MSLGRRVRALVIVLAASTWPSIDAGEEFLGVLIPRQETNLVPLVEGRLEAVYVRIGDRVERGAMVALIDDGPILRELESADARLAEANAARAEVATKLGMAEESLTRLSALAEDQMVSREQARKAEQERELARSVLEIAQARVDQQRAERARLNDKLASTKIRAPFTGTVAQRYVNPGATVGPQTAVIRLIASEALWARFAVPIERSGDLHTGSRVRVRVPEMAIETRGIIQQVSSEVDPASGMLFCEATVDPPTSWDGPPLAGQVVRVSLERDSPRER